MLYYSTKSTLRWHVFRVPDKGEWMVYRHARRQQGKGKTHRLVTGTHGWEIIRDL